MSYAKKLIAAAMTLAMALAICAVPALAENSTLSMDIAANDTHEYKVYQIFTGDLSGNVLSNVVYGNSGYGDEGESVPEATLNGITDADAFARSIADDVTTPIGTLKAGAASLSVPNGYYLIVDDTEKELAEGDAYSAYIVQVVKTTKVEPKKDTTSGDKKITTDTLGKDNATTTVNGKIDNVSIGDTVNFELTGTVPSHATDYDYYFFIMNDTLTEGLTFNASSVSVSASTKGALAADTDYKLYTGEDADGKTFQIALTDAKALAGQTITVTYNATLNENAVIGELSNDNTMTIEYSNNPNHNYDGDKDNNKPGKPKSDSHSPLGETPVVTTNTYTTGIKIMKVDENNQALTGAEFTITGDNEEIVLVSSEKFTESANGTYYKLKDGTYTTEAPITENSMQEAEAGATEGYVLAESDYTGTDTVEVGGKTYRPYKDGDTGQVYILIEANADQYDSPTTKYAKSIEFIQKDTNTSGVTATAAVDDNGVVTFKGLGQGTYTITESKVPDGYNKAADVTIDIAFTAEPETGAYHWSTTSKDASYNNAEGVFELTIENKSGSTLPTTGGMGTTILYVAGAIMVLVAGVYLITKRRASKESDL